MARTRKAEQAAEEAVTVEEQTPQIPQVTISRTALKKLVKLAEDLEYGDNAYKNCQATIYRNYVQGLYKAANTRNAVAAAREALGEE